MKKHFVLTVLLSLFASVVFAVPYASRIGVSDTTIAPGAGATITYFINQSGATVTIDIVDAATGTVVAATFPGTATVGANTVIWDGTVDNAGGADVADGQYRVKITAAATAAAGWVEIASNSSVGNYVPVANPTVYQTLWDGFSGMECLISRNTDSDAFGYVLCSTSYGTPPVYGHVVFNTDLSTFDGANGQSTWLNFAGTSNQTVWGNCFDPQDDEYIWACGQNIPNGAFYAKWNDATLQDVSNANTSLDNARDIAVAMTGVTKYAYVARGNSGVWRGDVTSGAFSATATDVINILGLTDTAKYSKGVDFDAAGNLYWSSRYNNSTSGEGAVVYRWDKATVDAATAGSLTEANSSWEVFFPTGASNGEGVTITPDGNVYGAVVNEGGLGTPNDGSLRGIYLIGNVSQATNKRTMTVSDRVFAYYGTTSFFSAFGHGLSSDIAGNIYFTDRSSEMIRCVGPEGNTNIAITAPTSQTIDISTLPTEAHSWSLYQ